jgi:hypothetical protein
LLCASSRKGRKAEEGRGEGAPCPAREEKCRREGRGPWLELDVAPHLELVVDVASPWSSDRRRRRCRAGAKEDAPPLLLPPSEDGAVALNLVAGVLDPHPSSA